MDSLLEWLTNRNRGEILVVNTRMDASVSVREMAKKKGYEYMTADCRGIVDSETVWTGLVGIIKGLTINREISV